MNKLQSKITNMDFKKTAKRFVLLSLIIVLLGGTLTGFMFRQQISEAITYHRTYENTRYGEERYGDREDHEGEHDRGEAGFFESGQFTRPTAGAIAAFVTYVSLCGLLVLSYWLLVMAWIYRAAYKAGMNRTLWTILAFFFNLAAVIAFLIMRSMQTICPGCGTYQKAGSFCRVCGSALQVKCTECGILLDKKDVYCPHCGKKTIV